MRIDPTLMKELTAAIAKASSNPAAGQAKTGGSTLTYDLGDVVLTLVKTDKLRMQHLDFSVLGRDFRVAPNLSTKLVIKDSEGNVDEEYPLEDEALQEQLQVFLRWRLAMIKNFGG